MSENNKSNEFTLIRVYDAPVHVVWDAWTDPKKVEKWWGPRGFTLTTHSKNLKVGGHWHYTMHGPDGTDYPNKTLYHEVEPCKRLVYDHGGDDDRPPIFRVTVIFQSLGDQTQITMTMACPTPEAATQTQQFIKKAGGNATWDRLAEYLAKELSGKDVFVITRSFAATTVRLFEMWRDPQHVSHWLGPVGTRMDFIEVGKVEGETSFYKMTYDTGTVMYGKIQYLKITPPHYLEYVHVFCDEQGALSRHPNVPVWPERMRTCVFFSPEEGLQTRVTLIWQPDGVVSVAELHAFADMRTGITQGWTEAFDKLEGHLEG
jgi:uncharacterized protein YndB with AHSA1/START domain